ncbi:MAG: GlcG/HbpS family heme-binding protein [Xanthobacteraceae bacterium]
MPKTLNRLSLIALICAIAAPAGAQLLLRKDLSYSIAKTIAEGALENCKSRGYNVSVVVVDRAGETIVALRGDDASPHTMENARRKAYTARSFRQTTTEYAKKFEDNNPVVRQQVTLPSIIAIPGGVPIKVGDDVIGGVGLSGSPGVDEPCVLAGLAKVTDQLR